VQQQADKRNDRMQKKTAQAEGLKIKKLKEPKSCAIAPSAKSANKMR
jgi:hypothetical protein